MDRNKRVLVMGQEMTKDKIQGMFACWDYFPPKSAIWLIIYRWDKDDKEVLQEHIGIKKRGRRDYSITSGLDFTNKKNMIDELWDMIKTNWEEIPESERLKL